MNKTKEKRQCEQCNKVFIPKRLGGRHKGRFCSRECVFKNKEIKKICPVCKTEFRADQAIRIYCSNKCSYEALRGSGNPSWNGGKEERRCVTCGNTFSMFPSTVTATCSPECYKAHMSKKFVGENNPNWRGGREVKCIVCGKNFWRCPSEGGQFCSSACFHKVRFGKGSSSFPKNKFGMSGVRAGKREDLGIFVRSSWEANYARYLNFLKRHGEIISWEYEPETFEFHSIKRGTRFYTPDFKVKLSSGQCEYHEVKGWRHPKGETALKRMAKYYPDIKIIIIAKKEYYALAKQLKGIISEWE